MKLKITKNLNSDEEICVNVHKETSLLDDLEKLVSSYNNELNLKGFYEDEIVPLSLSEIECFSVIDKKTFAITKDNKEYKINYRLYELESKLPSNFFRINKSAIANENYIKKFDASFSGNINCVFKSGYKDYVSRRCFSVIKRRFN